MTETCLFDDGLPRLVQILTSRLGIEAVESGVFVRDVVGALSFVARQELTEHQIAELSADVTTQLTYYARPDRVIVSASEPGAQRLLRDPAALRISISTNALEAVV